MTTRPSRQLESFPNPNPGRDYEIAFEAPEFTCLCPMTGQPDFATIRIRYIPDQKCVELKSLKLYFHAYRNEAQTKINQLQERIKELNQKLMAVQGAKR